MIGKTRQSPSSSPLVKLGVSLLCVAGAAAACSGTSRSNGTLSPGLGASSPDSGASADASTGGPPASDAATGDTAVPAPPDAATTGAAADSGDAGAADAGVTPASWMSAIPGSVSLAALSIPGTHDTGATVELSPGTTTCQNLSVDEQLAIGVRYFDIRCRNVSNAFEVYHTTVDQNLSFDQVLQSISTFFAANPGETLVMSLKEEATATGSTNTFEQTFGQYVAKQPNLWYLGPSIPTLDQARGKIVLLRRFTAATLPTGIDAMAWANNTTFTIADSDATLRIQDYYQVTDDTSKWAAITGLFAEATQGDAGVLYLNNTSGYVELDSGLENIPAVSDTIDPEVTSYFTSSAVGRYGIVAMDFVDATKSSLILSTNFQ
jgi:1-phosphatidylinositol phosphodiesterase